MKKVVSGGGGVANLWSSFQKVSGFTYKNPNIAALKHGRKTEGYAAEKFKVLSGKEHKNLSRKHAHIQFVIKNAHKLNAHIQFVIKTLPVVMFYFHI